MDKQFQARWRKAEAELRDLRQSNSAQTQTLASKLQETQLEHQQLDSAQERQLQLEAQALRQSQQEEHQASSLARDMNLQYESSVGKEKNNLRFSNHVENAALSTSILQSGDP